MEPWQIALVIFGPFGGVWIALNGTKERVKETLQAVTRIDAKLDEHGNRLTAIETKMETET